MRTKTKCVAPAMAAAAAAVICLVPVEARSADHRDAPATKADAAADINDVFTFVDGSRFVMAMTVSPFATSGATFSNATAYVFHTSSGAAFGKTTFDVDVICTFASPESASCWVGSADYVSGDPSNASAPLTSASGKTMVFAGLRGDPFFFNLSGFNDAETAVENAAAGLKFDATGCPAVDAATSAALVGTLNEVASSANPARTNADDFAAADTLAIVVSVDRSLVTQGGDIVSVWASTNMMQ